MRTGVFQASTLWKRFGFLLLWLLWLVLLAAQAAEAPFSFDATPGQLPKTAIPHRYGITLEPDLSTLTFKGRETIDIEVRQPASQLALNSLELSGLKAKVLRWRISGLATL